MRQALAVVLVAGCLSGCASSRIDTYPQEWSPAEPAAQGSCPIISGRYVNDGFLTEQLASYCAEKSRRKHPPLNAWSCDRRLSANLGLEAALSAQWIEIEQRDADTLQISIPQDHSVVPWVLKRSGGDFRCDSSP